MNRRPVPVPGDILRGLVIDAVDDEGRGRAMVNAGDGGGFELAVRGALPGDVVDATIERVFAARGLAQARRLGPLGPGAGPLHITRTCAHAGPCPACPLHGVDEGFVQGLKRSRVERALLDAGLPGELVAATLHDTVYGGGIRQKVKLVIGAGAGDGLVFGHYVPHSHGLVEAAGCALADDDMQRAVHDLRERMQAAGLGATLLRAVILRRFVEGVAAVVVAAGPCPVPLSSLWPTDALLGLGWRVQSAASSANAIVGGTVDDVDGVVGAIWGTPPGGGAPVVVDSFCQADSVGADWLVNRACAHVMDGDNDDDDDTVVLDLYAGAGAFARGLLAHGARRVVAVESFSASVDALARLSPLVRAVGGRVEDVLDEALSQGPRAAVVDPPRKGLGPVARRLGTATTLKRVALVSCDVDAGANDAKALVDTGFTVDAVIPVDLFRGSAEVEVLTLLSRR